MATFTVTTALDVVNPADGALSLREAVQQANATAAADTILFAGPIEGRTLTLTQGQLRLTGDVTIDGDRDDNGSTVTIDGNENGRVMEIAGGGTATSLTDLTLANGHAPGIYDNGGAILLGGGTLDLHGCAIRGSSAGTDLGYSGGAGSGGGIYAEDGSRVTVVNSSITGNNCAFGSGGGIKGGSNVTLVVRNSDLSYNFAAGGGAIDLGPSSSLIMDRSIVSGNDVGGPVVGGTGGIRLYRSTATITQCTIDGNYRGAITAVDGSRVTVASSTISNNSGDYSAISSFSSRTMLVDSTISGNTPFSDLSGGGGISAVDGELVLRGCTVTGNLSDSYAGGIRISDYGSTRLDIANSIVAGNFDVSGEGTPVPSDIIGAITSSNGHNIFGSAVAGEVAGDLENVAAARLFAALDPATGGGRLAFHGGLSATVRLRDAIDNPALSGADPLDADATDQRGVDRPLPVISNPDIGSFELRQSELSTRPSPNNDVLAGTARTDTLVALAGNDLVRGLGGDDDLRGVSGSDTLEGGAGHDRLDGGSGSDLLFGDAGNDRLLGGFNTDRLFAGAGDDVLRGQAGADRLRGDAGRDVFDVDAGESGVGAGRRDVILDFRRGADRIDLASIDADAGRAGEQAFTFLGTGALTGAGQLRYGFTGTSTVIQASTDVDAAPELEIELAGRIMLSSGDFVL